MTYDPLDHRISGRTGAAGGVLWVILFALLVFFGDRLPDPQSLASTCHAQAIIMPRVEFAWLPSDCGPVVPRPVTLNPRSTRRT